MPNTFRPEASPFFVAADGQTDCLAAFDDVISQMADGDILQLSGPGPYLLSGPLEIMRDIVIQGELAPHFVENPAEIFTAIGQPGLRLFGKCTLMNLQLTALRPPPPRPEFSWRILSSVVAGNVCTVTLGTRLPPPATPPPPPPHNIVMGSFITTSGLALITPSGLRAHNTSRASVINVTDTTVAFPFVAADGDYGPGYITSANHGIWSRRTVRLVNVGVNHYRGDGVFLDSNTLSALTTTVEVDANGVALVTTLHPHPFQPGMLVTSSGWTRDLTVERPVLAVPAPNQFTVFLGGANDVTDGQGTVRSASNADHWHADTLRVLNNLGHGFHTVGSRANAGVGIKIDATNNHAVGVWEEGFLGNTYLACHTAGNVLGSYVKPVPADNNRTIFLGCYAETNQPNPICTRPATRYAGQGGWTGGGLANGWRVDQGVSTFDNANPEAVGSATVTAARIENNGLICTVASNQRVRRGMLASGSTGLVNNLPGPAVAEVDPATPTIVRFPFQHGDVMDNLIPNVPHELHFPNNVQFEIGGRPSSIYNMRSFMDQIGGGRYYSKLYVPDMRGQGSQWYVTRYGGAPDGIVEAESGQFSFDDTLSLTGPAQKWFPHGMFFGQTRHMAKFDSTHRTNANYAYPCLLYREGGGTPAAAPATRAIAWGPAAPSGGDPDQWAPGDIVWNSAPGASGPLGWMCTAPSSPTAPAGTWEEMPRLRPNSVGRSVEEVIRVSFGPPDAADLIIYNGNCPVSTRILDVQILVSTAAAGSLQFQDAIGIAASLLSDPFVTTAIGRFRSTGSAVTATPVIPVGGTLVLHRSNAAAVGEAIISVQR